MDHSHIVAMLDACLERLYAARRLLSNQKHSSAVDKLLQSANAGIAQTKKKARPKISIKKKQRDELTPSLFSQITETAAPMLPVSTQAEEVMVAPITVVAAKQLVVVTPRRRLVERPPVAHTPRRKTAAPSSALVGHVPSGPVFIPAAQVPQERPKVRIENASKSQSDAAPLTAELLAQRWIQSAGF